MRSLALAGILIGMALAAVPVAAGGVLLYASPDGNDAWSGHLA